MSQHIHRVTVRGHFADLDADTRAALTAAAEEHSIFRSAYTAEGTFAYEPNLVAFSFRYELRSRADDHQAEVEATALARATSYLADRAIGAKHLKVRSVDMADIWEPEAD